MRYWAFLSYSRQDEQWARALHSRLEGYRIPRPARPVAVPPGLPNERLRPIFRDKDELAASSDLGASLRAALDASRFLIVLASRSSAASAWVNAEVRHFIDTGRAADILVVVIDGEIGDPVGDDVFPPALVPLAKTLLWVDARGEAKPRRETVFRLIAGMLGVGFDVLWGRERRRLVRRGLGLTAAIAAVSVAVALIVWRQQTAADLKRPDRQQEAFRQWLTSEIVEDETPEPSVKLSILLAEDLDRNGWLDFAVVNSTSGYCGSGGCGFDVYLTRSPGDYSSVLSLLGGSTPRSRAQPPDPYLQFVVTDLTVGSEPLYTVYRLIDGKYRLAQYEFCDGVFYEYCADPAVIVPLPKRLAVRPNATYRVAPREDASEVTGVEGPQAGSPGGAVAEVAGGQWFLAEIWKGRSAFVARRDVVL